MIVPGHHLRITHHIRTHIRKIQMVWIFKNSSSQIMCNSKSSSSFACWCILVLVIHQAVAMEDFAVSEHTDASELQAVYDVMEATGNGWATKIHDVCKGRWHGIECVADKEHVLHVVSLSFGVLSDDTAFPVCSDNARISPSVAKLKHLRRLFFFQCCKGNPQSIPPEIGRLGASLEALVLRDNGHIGSIPRELANLSKLHSMDLHSNNLSSAIPTALPNPGNLQLLDLSSNRLEGQIPSSLGLLKSLRVLDLSNNHLHGAIPGALGNLINLKKLDLSSNQLAGPIPPALGQLRSIVLIDCSHNALTGGIPPSFGNLTELQALIVKGTRMQASIPSSLGNLAKLQALVLSNSDIVGPIPSSLGRLSKLQVLYLDQNRLNGSIPSEFGHLSALSEFNVESNNLYGRIPFSGKLLLKLGQRLRLNNNSGLCYAASISTEAYLLPGSIIQCKGTSDGSHHKTNLPHSSNSATKSFSRQLLMINWPVRIALTAVISTTLVSSLTYMLIVVCL
ncbi:hypothetical protein O6H91_01G041700 [Diphasiastrum complanatum]|uniref:Uncharacterized protein n=1 Tax=Diphasiastrum complanatum TaxID=34168 RepID=A0ACC2EQA1_DIPCM|nr:hypothetical protein O6H91_01G041700 [Diphasiastrum complanatum]